MKFIQRIQEAEAYTDYFIGYVWRDIHDYNTGGVVKKIGKWFEIIINLGKLTLIASWQWRNKR